MHFTTTPPTPKKPKTLKNALAEISCHSLALLFVFKLLHGK